MKQKPSLQMVLIACSLASIAFMLAPALFAVSSRLSLRSLHTPQQSALGHITQALADAILVVFPSLLTLRPIHRWPWAVAAMIASAIALPLSLQALPSLPFAVIITNRALWMFFAVALAIMATSALLGPAFRICLSMQRWIPLSCFAVAYLFIASAAYLLTGFPLYVE